MLGTAASIGLTIANNHLQNQYNMEMYNKNLQAQRDLMSYQDRLNRNSAIQLFNLENEYNHPRAVLERELSAGMNPFAIASEQGAGRSAPGDISTPRADIPSLQAPQALAPLSGLAQDFVSIANAYKAVADAENAGVNTDMLRKNMQTWLDTNAEQLTSMRYNNQFQEIKLDIEREFGRDLAAATLAKVAGETMLNLAKENEAIMNKNLIEQKIKESISQTEINKVTKDQLEKMTPWLVKEIMQKINTYKAQENMYNEQGFAARSSGLLDLGKLKTENDVRQYVVENAHQMARMNKQQTDEFIRELQETWKLKYWQVQFLETQIEHLQNVDDKLEWDQTTGAIVDVMKSIISVAGKK